MLRNIWVKAAKLRALALWGVLAGTLGACGPAWGLDTLQLVTLPGANQNSATAIDIVFVYQGNALAQLPKTGPEWFDKKAALLAYLGMDVEVASFLMPPGVTVQAVLPPRRAGAITVYSYANMISPAGQPVGYLGALRNGLIRVDPYGVSYFEAQ